MQPNQKASLASAGLAVLILVSLVTPWWTVHATSSGSFGGFSVNVSSGPFNDTPISTGKAVVSGLLVLFALLGAIAGAVFLWSVPKLAKWAPLATASAGGLTLLAVLLAAFTWPENGGFWDSGSGSGGGFSVSATTYASFGWYAAAVAVIGAGFATLLALRLSTGAHEAQPTGAVAEPTAESPPLVTLREKPVAAQTVNSIRPTPATTVQVTDRCSATTKSGTRCARKATAGTVCSVHA